MTVALLVAALLVVPTPRAAQAAIAHDPTVPAPTSFTQLTAGFWHTCGLAADGTALCWGYDGDGQLGNDATTGNQPTPVAVAMPANTTFTQLTAGSHHTCGLAADGTAFCWGNDASGQLGNDAPTVDQSTPVAVAMPANTTFTQLTAGSFHTCGLAADGTALCWGNDGDGQLGNDAPTGNQPTPVAVAMPANTTFTQLTAGSNSHTCGLAADGTAWCWGNDGDGQLGNDAPLDNEPTPVAVDTSSLPVGTVFTQLTGGDLHTCGLTADGTAWCWGNDSSGQLGNGAATSANQASPSPVDTSSLPVGTTFTQLTSGSNHTCGLAATGTAFCWGYDSVGQLGDDAATDNEPSPVAVAMPANTTFTQLAGGNSHTCGLAADGTAFCWGYDASGQLGNDAPTVDQSTPDAVAMPGNTTFTQLTSGNWHTCGLAADGTAFCWGDNPSGELGNDNAPNDEPTPVAVAMPANTTFTQLTAGYSHTCGLAADGTAFCWGRDDFGQLGNGAGVSGNQPSPVAVVMPGGTSFTHLTARHWHTCGLAADGTAFCWGNDTYGRLGDDAATDDKPSPVAVAMPGDAYAFTDVAAATNHTCGLTAGGTAWCWGRDFHGQLGNGATAGDQATPSAVDISVSVTVDDVVGSIGEQVTFTAVGEGVGPASYQWLRDDVEIPGATDPTYQRTLIAGDHGVDFAVTITNVFASSGSDTAAVTSLPVADAGGPYTVDEGGTVALYATDSSDDDGDTLAYAWDLDDDGVFDDAIGATPTFDAGGRSGPATIYIAVRVNDGTTTTDDTTTIDIDNVAPTADAGGPYTVDEDDTVTLDATGSSDPVDTLTYAWDLDGDGNFDDATGATPTFHATDIDGPDSAVVAVRVSDGTTTDDATATVTIGNVAPTANAGGPYTVDEDDTVTLDATGSSDPVDTLTYAWDLDGDGNFDDATGATPTFEGFPVATDTPVQVAVRVSDGTDTDEATATVTVVHVAGPVVRFIGDAADGAVTTTEGVPVTLEVTVEPAHAVLTWDLDDDGVFDDATGTTATVIRDDEGTHPIAVQAVDGSKSAIAVATVVVRDGTTTTERVFADDRIGTALATSRDTFADGAADHIVLARDDVFADALAGTALAVRANAPLLLTASTHVRADVLDEIDRVLRPGGTIYLLGGPAALSDDVIDDLAPRTSARLFGDTRYETAVAIADEAIRLAGTPDTILIARGDDFPDGLAAGAVAALTNGVVVLSRGTTPAAATTAFLAGHPAANQFAVGGHAAVAHPEAEPIVGSDRYATAVALANRFFAQPELAGLARGGDFPDAMTGGVHIGRLGGPLLLTRPHDLPDATMNYLCTHHTSIDTAWTYGGPNAIHDDTVTALDHSLDGTNC